MKSKLVFLLGAATGLLLGGIWFWNGSFKPHIIITDTTGATHRVDVELAITPEQHQRGLMERPSMPKDHGMLFIFKNEQLRTFWMKNTLMPLDIIFINHNQKIVGIIENAEPQSLNFLSVNEPSLFVLEVHGGWCKTHRVMNGCLVYFINISSKP